VVWSSYLVQYKKITLDPRCSTQPCLLFFLACHDPGPAPSGYSCCSFDSSWPGVSWHNQPLQRDPPHTMHHCSFGFNTSSVSSMANRKLALTFWADLSKVLITPRPKRSSMPARPRDQTVDIMQSYPSSLPPPASLLFHYITFTVEYSRDSAPHGKVERLVSSRMA